MSEHENFFLFLLIGQSNMAGRGPVEPQDKEIHHRVFSFNKKCEWIPASDPVHFDKDYAAVGPGLTFGKSLADHFPNSKIGLIPCAVGGTAIAFWEPGVLFEGLQVRCYDQAVQRAREAMKSGVLKGILWHQGEGDSVEKEAELYEARLTKLIQSLRTDLNSEVPFITGTLCEFFLENNPKGLVVNQAMRDASKKLKQVGFIESSGLCHKGDQLHFDAESAREMGRRYAKAMVRMLSLEK